MQKNKEKLSKLKTFIHIIFLFVIIGVLLSTSGVITKRKESDRKYADYKDNAQNIDVLFLGSSHMLNAINPAQVFGQTGISSYNMAKHGGMIPESYWTYKLACQYCNPKCVVIDLWSLDRDYKYLDKMDGTKDDSEIRNSVSLLHSNMDSWPLSKTKIQAVCDLLSSSDARIEFLFPFSLYHSRWSTIGKDDFILDNSKSDSDQYVLGSEARSEILLNHNTYEPEEKNVTLAEETVSTLYLRKLIEECQAEGTEVILTFMPMANSSPQDFQAVNYGKEMADEYGLDFINLLDHSNQNIVDYESDMSDETHVNELGMYKLSQYIGQILSERDYLTDHRGQAGYEFFDQTYSSWQSNIINRLLNTDDLYMALGHANMLNVNVALLVRGDSAALRDSFICNQIAKISGTDKIYQAKDVNGPYFLLKEAIPEVGDLRIHECCGEAQESEIPTLSGNGEYIGMSNFAAFYYNGDYDNNLFDMYENYNADLQLFILGADGEVLKDKYYSCGW